MKWKATSSRIGIAPPPALAPLVEETPMDMDQVLAELPAKIDEARASLADPALRFDYELWIRWALEALPIFRAELEAAQRRAAERA